MSNFVNRSFDGSSFKVIAKNSIYNLFGYSIPLLVAIVAIPVLLKTLGTEKFGLLNLAWIIIGYFGFFDLGVGRALTKIVAEKIGANSFSDIPVFFWTSIFFMMTFSFFLSVLLYLISNKIVFNYLKIPQGLQEETLLAFYLLIFSIPIVSTTAGMKGFFEAYQRFDVVNIIRVALGISSFLVPVIVIFFTQSLFWIVLSLVFIRIVIWIVYLIQSFNLNNEIRKKVSFDLNVVKQIFKLSSWMTVSNFTVPLIVYLDRILIASLVSSAAVAYYSTPYEVITKLLIIPSALTAVLFPTFAANYLRDSAGTIRLSAKAMKYIFILLLPVILAVVIFSFELLSFWLGNEFAQNSYIILQLLSIGILFNSIGYIPFSFIEGIGRPDVTAKIQLIELPVYLIAMWLMIKFYGTTGAAAVFMIRMILDSALMFYFSRRISGGSISFRSRPEVFIVFSLIILLSIFILNFQVTIKLIATGFMILAFILYSWKKFLDFEDKQFILIKLKNLGIR